MARSSRGQTELSWPVLSLSGSVALGKSHHLSGPQSAHLHNEEAGQMVSDRVPSNLRPAPSPVQASLLFPVYVIS